MLRLALTAELDRFLLLFIFVSSIPVIQFVSKKQRKPKPTRLLLCNACIPNKKWRVDEKEITQPGAEDDPHHPAVILTISKKK